MFISSLIFKDRLETDRLYLRPVKCHSRLKRVCGEKCFLCSVAWILTLQPWTSSPIIWQELFLGPNRSLAELWGNSAPNGGGVLPSPALSRGNHSCPVLTPSGEGGVGGRGQWCEDLSSGSLNLPSFSSSSTFSPPSASVSCLNFLKSFLPFCFHIL